jgi:dihydrolipoamide dehydrogenase
MPSKLLVAAAEASHQVAAAGRFGIRVPDGVRVDGRAVLERVRRERDRFVGVVIETVEAIPAAQRLRGHEALGHRDEEADAEASGTGTP